MNKEFNLNYDYAVSSSPIGAAACGFSPKEFDNNLGCVFNSLLKYSQTTICKKHHEYVDAENVKTYYWFSPKLILIQNPYCRFTSISGARKCLNKLCDIGLLKRYEHNKVRSVSFFTWGPKYDTYMRASSTNNKAIQLPFDRSDLKVALPEVGQEDTRTGVTGLPDFGQETINKEPLTINQEKYIEKNESIKGKMDYSFFIENELEEHIWPFTLVELDGLINHLRSDTEKVTALMQEFVYKGTLDEFDAFLESWVGDQSSYTYSFRSFLSIKAKLKTWSLNADRKKKTNSVPVARLPKFDAQQFSAVLRIELERRKKRDFVTKSEKYAVMNTLNLIESAQRRGYAKGLGEWSMILFKLPWKSNKFVNKSRFTYEELAELFLDYPRFGDVEIVYRAVKQMIETNFYNKIPRFYDALRKALDDVKSKLDENELQNIRNIKSYDFSKINRL